MIHEIDGTLYRSMSHWGLWPVYVEGNPFPARYDAYKRRLPLAKAKHIDEPV